MFDSEIFDSRFLSLGEKKFSPAQPDLGGFVFYVENDVDDDVDDDDDDDDDALTC